MTGSEIPDEHAYGQAFALLGNETRVAILHELWRSLGEGPVSFSDLRERVGMRDSGQFNYHLTKLTDAFVRKTDDGYSLRFAGMAVVGSILSGHYEQAGFDEPIPVEGACASCDGPLRFTYVDERATIDCADCGRGVSSASVPAGVFAGRDREDAPELFDRWLRAQVDRVAAGFCMACTGPTTPQVAAENPPSETPAGTNSPQQPFVVYECARCNERVTSSVTEAVTRHPAVVAFHHEHAIDLRTEPTWALDWLHVPVEILAADPLRVAFDVTLDDETLRLTVDEDLVVLAEERRAARTLEQ
ncbi:ArsR/SmtB family transcription factor [Haloarchaeobius sp. TZWWS8]|uniref:ArsR/SmtB family transcription factor n=1 Tax=Haloarchaeobius sp. TZWWS8 TaxID=3446121 RepID=UPI003EBA9264